MAVQAQVHIPNDTVPEAYRGYFDDADWTLHKLVVAGSWLFVVAAVVMHLWMLSIPNS